MKERMREGSFCWLPSGHSDTETASRSSSAAAAFSRFTMQIRHSISKLSAQLSGFLLRPLSALVLPFNGVTLIA